ncbi:ribose 5-phosphate isomerase B [Thalassoglobus polymorphus]|uniref:Sugar phosphate isomerase YwlF n=1 Tax=Thalassoglobus polymorphus TaxID=2527994 RepID=A0A517QSD5_9PLAN|nr:ribose 5-phosphate isomerase B [Thalassoglobus polymorphus]QDT34533.1 Putative sugar phosphate isomerase YwlF [Thalassoglobus polymorphus]
MKVAIASDHRGVRVKGQILAQLDELGYEGVDYGPGDDTSVDYPDYAGKVAKAVGTGEVDRGILICGTGMGMCITANKFPKVRAVSCHDDVTAEYSRRHNDANIMCLSADMLGDRLLGRIVDLWLKTEFEGGRHQRRIEKISDIEHKYCCSETPSEAGKTSCDMT